MIDARKDDGRFGPSQFVPNSNPGYWDPVAPNGTTALDPTPWVGGVKPFLMQSSSQFRSAGPLALNSAAYAADFNEVKARAGPPAPPARTSRRTSPGGGRATPSRAGTTSPASSSHGTISTFPTRPPPRDGKPRGGGRGDQHLERQVPLRLLAAVSGDPQGGGRRQLRDRCLTLTLDAAPHRALPRAHVGTPRARRLAHQRAADVLRQRTRGGLPDHEQLRESRRARALDTCPATRTFTSFSQAVDEIVEARIWAGLHFRTADVQAVAGSERTSRTSGRELLPARGQSLTRNWARSVD